MMSEGFTLLEILAIDVALSGDNAIAVGLAAAGLPVDQRRKVIFWGLAGAVVLRVLFALIAAKLLLITGLQLLGGLLLVWVGWKLLTELREQDAADADHDGVADHAT
ncbi:MAG: TerC family protein, partial [Aquidulcibacter sp.]|nr:TerC family protein [Aquidulcibacter sp.]